jgi:polysaccharide pyruvyl transferase WcaK-like protein
LSKTIVFVRGVGSHNGGAEILLRAAHDRVKSSSVDVVADTRKVSRSLRKRWDVGAYFSVPKFGSLESLGLDLLPTTAARALGTVSSRHVNAVLDASGFAVGDQWSSESIARDAATFARHKKRGAPIVLLPQAFGPFRKADVARAARSLFSNIDLICVRDAESYRHVAELRGTDQSMLLSPDITIALEVKHRKTAGRSSDARRIAIVPNINLAARSADSDALARYAHSLFSMNQALLGHGLDPFFLVHSSQGDPRVIEAVEQLGQVKVVVPKDGLDAKGIIGESTGIIAGRYHAIVSALSQGVPAVAHSWSHKYGALLSDFGVDRGLVDPFDAEGSVMELLELIGDESYRGKLQSAKPKLVGSIETVWGRVDELLLARGVRR